MILADKIINERKKNGWSQEELAEKLSVSRQSISKWEGAQAVPDLQRILKMAEIFNVSTDYLLKDEIEADDAPASVNTDSDSMPPLKKVSLEEANRFLKYKVWALPRTAIATVLCITCPVILIILAGINSSFPSVISENIAAIIGLIILFLQIAIAVFMFIKTDEKGKDFNYIETEDIDTEYGVEGLAKELRDKYSQKYTRGVTVGVCMCILSSLPIMITAVLGMSDSIIASTVALLLVVVAVAVYIFIITCGKMDSYNMLLQERDFTHQSKIKRKKIAPYCKIYWSLVTAIFLGYSFITRKWDYSWIIFAVAGVFYAVFRRIVLMSLGLTDDNN